MEPRYLLPRAALAVFALVAATTVALPSDGFTWAVWWGDWALVPTLVIGNITASVAIAISIAMVLRVEAFRRAWPLGLGLCAAVAAWGIWTSPWLSSNQSAMALLPIAWMTAALSVANFYISFPQKASPEAVRALFYQVRQRTLDTTRSKFMGAPDDSSGVHDPVAYFDAPVNWMSRISALAIGKERYRNWVLGSVKREQDRLARDMASVRHNRILLMFATIITRPWPVLGALIAALVLLAVFTADSYEIFVVVPAAIYIPLAMITARERYLALNNRDDRVRALWLLQGLVIGYLCVSLWVPALIISALMDSPLRLGLAPIVLASGALAFVGCLAVAVFRFGALDPALVMRRSIVLGTIIILLTLLFAVIETFVSGLLTDWLDLPANSGAYAASATAALVFGPLWNRLTFWADRLVDRVFPKQDANV